MRITAALRATARWRLRHVRRFQRLVWRSLSPETRRRARVRVAYRIWAQGIARGWITPQRVATVLEFVERERLADALRRQGRGDTRAGAQVPGGRAHEGDVRVAYRLWAQGIGRGWITPLHVAAVLQFVERERLAEALRRHNARNAGSRAQGSGERAHRGDGA